ncbi:hypothetical protein Dimus_018425 [Dionaea muscipula]
MAVALLSCCAGGLHMGCIVDGLLVHKWLRLVLHAASSKLLIDSITRWASSCGLRATYYVALIITWETEIHSCWLHSTCAWGMCGLRRENGVRWLGSGNNRRRDEEENEEESDSEMELEDDTSGESTPAGSKGGQTEQEVETAKATDSGSMEDFYDAEEGDEGTDAHDEGPVAPTTQPVVQQ